jgi:hypothetical protein
MARLETIADEARRERVPYFSTEPDLKPLLRTLLRLRHDLVIIGRSAVQPLPEVFRKRLCPSIERIAGNAAAFAEGCGEALLSGRSPPLHEFEAALAAYEAEIAAMRAEGLTRSLSGESIERLFGQGFALEQLHQDLKDLSRWVADFAQAPERKRAQASAINGS